VRRALAGPGFAAEARKHGLTQVRILVLSASTASHICDALIGTAIRFKFLLDVTVAEYEEPEPWLERNRSELKENPPDFVLVASDSRMLKLTSQLGDEAAAAQMVGAALARIARIAEVAGAATGRPVILQTLAGDPDAIVQRQRPTQANEVRCNEGCTEGHGVLATALPGGSIYDSGDLRGRPLRTAETPGARPAR